MSNNLKRVLTLLVVLTILGIIIGIFYCFSTYPLIAVWSIIAICVIYIMWLVGTLIWEWEDLWYRIDMWLDKRMTKRNKNL